MGNCANCSGSARTKEERDKRNKEAYERFLQKRDPKVVEIPELGIKIIPRTLPEM